MLSIVPSMEPVHEHVRIKIEGRGALASLKLQTAVSPSICIPKFKVYHFSEMVLGASKDGSLWEAIGRDFVHKTFCSPLIMPGYTKSAPLALKLSAYLLYIVASTKSGTRAWGIHANGQRSSLNIQTFEHLYLQHKASCTSIVS